MRQILIKAVNTMDRISRWSGMILSLLILLMIGIVMYEVIARYLFDSPTSWGLEAATMVFGTYMICGGAYALLEKAHVNMDIFHARWSERTQAIVDVVTYPFALFLLALIFWQSLNYGIESIQMDEHAQTVWGPPLYHWKITVSFGLLIMIMQQLSDFIRNLTMAITGDKLQ